MKIWVDGQCFQTGSNVRGIGRYVIDFLSALSVYDVDIIISLNGSMQQETVAARTYIKKALPNASITMWYGTENRAEIDVGYSPERRVDEILLASHIREINPDIALSPSPFEGTVDRSNPFIKTSLLESIKTACIFHDAIPHRYPDIYLEHESVNNLYYRRFDEISNFDLVLCNSQFTEDEYQDIYEQTNSAAIFAGLSDDMQNLINSWVYDAESVGAKLGDYVVYVGGLDWRKNVPCLVKAMANMPQCRAGELKLVLVGEFGDVEFKAVTDLFKEYNIPEDYIIKTGYVSDKELVDLYKNSVACVQPSRMEGFGLGALEAMACGTPFFSAVGGAVGEVVQNDAQMFDPDIHFSLSQLLQKLLSDDEFREQVILHGYNRLQEFTWTRTAQIAMAEFKELLKDSSPSINNISKQEIKDQQRLIMDVTSTALSPVMSGIQRVMHKLSSAAIKQNEVEDSQTILSFSQNTKDWYSLADLNKSSVLLKPEHRINYQNNDSYLLLDSSWNFIEGQQQRLTDALVMGQEVVNGIHDIGPLTMPAMTDAGMPPAFRRWFEFVLGYSTGIVCVSRAVADEVYQLIEDIKLPRPMKIGYFRLGANFADVEPDVSELGFTKTRPTFLMVGTIEPRKGQYYGLKAFEKLWEQGVDVNLVIVGHAGWDTKILQAVLENHPEREKRLFWRHGISDSGLAAAYQEADALIMTSYLEGFGLPVVEAGRKNCPVILADLPVFREVGEGAPKATYFEVGSAESLASTITDYIETELDVDHKAVEVNWPSWDESAQEIKDVVLNGNWHKYYEPEQVLPNTRLSDVGEIYTLKALEEHETTHTLNIAEGPFLSDDGSQLRIAVAVKNLSDNLWSSNLGREGGLNINLSYHLYDKAGNCISYDNPRTHIPFVLPANNEILLPIRIETDWLIKGAHTVGIELVQEGVRWFGNEKKLLITQPHVPEIEQNTPPSDYELSAPKLVYSRGPFGPEIDVEQYFLFAVINSEKFPLPYYGDDKESLFTYALVDKLGNKSYKGVWAVSHFDTVEAYNTGYLGLFANTKHIEESEFIEIYYNKHAWRFNLATHEIEQVKVKQVQPEVDFTWMDALNADTIKPQELAVAFSPDTPITLRGFNKLESSHVWMAETTGELDISNLLAEKTLITKAKVICSPFKELQEPIELSMYFGKKLVEKKTLSSDFMEYSFTITPDDMKALIKNQFRIKFITNGQGRELAGERMLSICFAKLSFTTLNANNI